MYNKYNILILRYLFPVLLCLVDVMIKNIGWQEVIAFLILECQ